MQPSEQDRATFAALADLLIPAWGRMPAPGAAVFAQLHALAACAGKDPSQAINALHGSDAAAFGALSLAVTGAYYMADEVWQQLGYPGQDGATYDPPATPD